MTFLFNHINYLIRFYRKGAVLRDPEIIIDVQNIYNAPYFTAHRATFYSTLLKEAVDAGILIKLRCPVTKVDFSEASVHQANGDVYRGDIVLRTDGENSQHRELMLARPDSPCHNGDNDYSGSISSRTVSVNIRISETSWTRLAFISSLVLALIVWASR